MFRDVSKNRSRLLLACIGMIGLASTVGCYAPLKSPGIPAPELPEEFRTPYRTMAPQLNLSTLTTPQPDDYILGPNDILEAYIPDLYEDQIVQSIRVQVMSDGSILLPLVGSVKVGGQNIVGALKTVNAAYADGILANPRVNLTLAEKATFEVVVLGEVEAPGVYPLPKYSNDVGHALAAAGGLSDVAAEVIEVHRRRRPALTMEPGAPEEPPQTVLRIPLRGMASKEIMPADVTLNPGDVVVVPNRKSEVFYVVGQLDDSNLVRFTLGERERELGQGLILPRDRDIDVVTAVAMAGYIDPIDSPTTVTVHRTLPGGEPLLITVDLIKARFDRRETVMVEGGDIIYINPDAQWYFRRQLDRIVPDLITMPYSRWMTRWILGKRSNVSVGTQ